MKRCFISRFGGAGDVLHASHLPELIKKHYGVDHITFETNYSGMHILTNNPFIDELLYVDTSRITDNRLEKNWEYQKENYDLFFNFVYTIEKEYCCNENDQKYYRSESWRRENLGKKSYYDVMIDAARLPEIYYGTRGKLYYSDEDNASALEWVNKKRSDGFDKIILINLSGSSLHKKFVQAESVVDAILNKYKNCLVILTGDKDCESQVFVRDRVISWVNKKNFRTVALMTKYMDLTISLESGLPLIAHSWDAPCLQLLTAASFDNHVKYAKNAYWLQSPVSCSPCHRNAREYLGCPIKQSMPACVWFNVEDIMKKVGEALG